MQPTAQGPDVEPLSGAGAGAEADPAAVARQIALRQLAAAPRSRQELARAMARRRVPAEVAEQVLDRLEDLRLIDDAEYARLLVASRREHRHLSAAALRHDLRGRGIDQDVIGEALKGIDTADELRTATEFALRRARSMAADEPLRRQRRLLSMLARKGYGAAVSRQAVNEALDQLGFLHHSLPDE